MKRRSVSGNVTVIEELHRPGPSEPQRVNPTSEVKKRKISSKAYNINYHQTRATCERVTETETKLPKISKVLEATEKVELTKKKARALVEQRKEANTPDNEAVVPSQTFQASTTTTVEQPPPAAAVAAAAATPQPHQEARNRQTQNQVPYVTRSGRVVKPLVRFK